MERAEKEKLIERIKPCLKLAIRKAFGPSVVYHPESDYVTEYYDSSVYIRGFDPHPKIAFYSCAILSKQLREGRTGYIKSIHGNCIRATKTRRGDLWDKYWVHAVSENVTTLDDAGLITGALVLQHSNDLTIRSQGYITFSRTGMPRVKVHTGESLLTGRLPAYKRVDWHEGWQRSNNSPKKSVVVSVPPPAPESESLSPSP